MSGMNLKELRENVAEKWGKKSVEKLSNFTEKEMKNKKQIFATKDDLDNLERKLERKIEFQINELRIEMGKMKFDLIKWIISLWIAQAVLMLTLK